jgi:hypothetical protein
MEPKFMQQKQNKIAGRMVKTKPICVSNAQIRDSHLWILY